MVNSVYWIYSPPLVGLGGLVVAALLYGSVNTSPAGNERMRELSDVVRRGGMVFLMKECRGAAVLAAGVFCLLAWQTGAAAGVAFLAGVGCSMLARFIGMDAVGRTHSRAVEAGRSMGPATAFRLAFRGGSVVGLGALSLTVIGLGGVFSVFHAPTTVRHLAAFALGAASVALLARTAGGIFAQVADSIPSVLRNVEPSVPEDARHPAVVAASIGQDLAGVGVGADVMGSCAFAIAASVTIAAASGATAESQRVAAMAYPLVLLASGLLGAVVGVFVVSGLRGRAPATARRGASLVSAAVFSVGAYGAAHMLGLPLRSLLCAALGLGAAILIELASDRSSGSRPSHRVAEASHAGPAANLVAGLAVGMEGCGLPALVIAGAMLGAHHLYGLYGIGLAALGMLANSAVSAGTASAAAIAANAATIARVSRLGPDVLEMMEALRLRGRRSSAAARGLATLGAAMAALTVFAAFGAATNLKAMELGHPAAAAGLLIGGVIPFLVGALALKAVGLSVYEMLTPARREIREAKGLVEGVSGAVPDASLSAAARSSLRHTVIPGLIALLAPLIVGFLLGAEALGGLLVGSTVTGFLLASFLVNAGNTWSRAKERIEMGAVGGRWSDSHSAATVGAAAGDLLAGAAAPAIGVAVQFMAILCLVIAPSLPPPG